MTAQSVAEIVKHHVRLTVEGIDRMYLNVYVPGLQCEQGVLDHKTTGVRMAGFGPMLPTLALQRFGSYLRCTCRDAKSVVTGSRTFAVVYS